MAGLFDRACRHELCMSELPYFDDLAVPARRCCLKQDRARCSWRLSPVRSQPVRAQATMAARDSERSMSALLMAAVQLDNLSAAFHSGVMDP